MDWRQQSQYPPYGGGYHQQGGFGHASPPPHFSQPPPHQPKLLGVGLDEALLGASNVHSKNVNSLGWSSGGGQRLATGSDDKSARVYDVDEAGQVKPLLKLDGHQDAVVQVRRAPCPAEAVYTRTPRPSAHTLDTRSLPRTCTRGFRQPWFGL
jgi:hypothetical protein